LALVAVVVLAGGSTAAGRCSSAVAAGVAVILAGAEPVGDEQALSRRSGHPLPGAGRQLSLVWMAVSSRVAAVQIDGRQTITPRADRRLPGGWRAVVAFTSTPSTARRSRRARRADVDRCQAP
jgi:hypothetical protein